VTVNKAQKIGKLGFGAISSLAKKIDASEPRSFSMPLQTTLTSLAPTPSPIEMSDLTGSGMGEGVQEKELVMATSPVSRADESELTAGMSFEIPQAPASAPASMPLSAEMEQKPVVVAAPRPGAMKVHAPVDPQDALICDSCQ
jgi:hypothetical protein